MVELSFNCPEDPNEMKLFKGNRKCESCSRLITDYTGMSNKEVALALRKSQENACGVFRGDQLVTPETSRMGSLFRLAIAAVFVFGLNVNSFGQDTTTVETDTIVKVNRLTVADVYLEERYDTYGGIPIQMLDLEDVLSDLPIIQGVVVERVTYRDVTEISALSPFNRLVIKENGEVRLIRSSND